MEKPIDPHLWKELKASWKVSMGSHIVGEGLIDSEALHWAWWQVVAFRLPLAQHKASGWWDAPPWLRRLCPEDFMFCTNASGPRYFRAMRYEKTLALAWALQACTEGSGSQHAFSVTQCENFKNAWPPWWPSAGMTSLRPPSWNPLKRSVEPPPLQRRKLSSWVINLSCQRPPRPHPSQNAQRSLNHQSPQSRLKLSLQSPPSKLTLLVLHFLCSNQGNTPPGRQRNPRERLGITWTKQGSGFAPTCRRMKECQNGGGSSDLFSALGMSTLVTSKSKSWPTSKLQPSGCQPHSWTKMAGGHLHPVFVCWGEKTTFTQISSRECEIIEWCGMKKWWHWPWPSRGVPFVLE